MRRKWLQMIRTVVSSPLSICDMPTRGGGCTERGWTESSKDGRGASQVGLKVMCSEREDEKVGSPEDIFMGSQENIERLGNNFELVESTQKRVRWLTHMKTAGEVCDTYLGTRRHEPENKRSLEHLHRVVKLGLYDSS